MWDAVLLLVVCIGLIVVAVVGLCHGLMLWVAIGVIVLAAIAAAAAGRAALVALPGKGERDTQG
jgi:hypothetical protein